MQKTEILGEPDDMLPAHIPAKIRQSIVRMRPSWQRRILLKQALAGQDIPGVLEPIDYDYRPASYWDPENLRHLVANIKGAERKKMALRLIEAERLDEASDFILEESLSEEERTLASQEHPALMGGEYLPGYGVAEVEIARVTMASVTQDVISIRAFPQPGRIGYRVVDEYKSNFEIKPAFSKRPLSLRQLVRLIDTGNSREMGPVGLGIIQIQFDCCEIAAESLADFMDFSSEFYSGLSKHYWFATQRWVEQNQKRGVAI